MDNEYVKDFDANKLSYDIGIGVGLFGAIFLLGLVGFVLDRQNYGSWHELVHEWQSLIAGLLALLSALLAVHAVRQQILQAASAEKERRERANVAARARLPLALHQLDRYCEQILLDLKFVCNGSDRETGVLLQEISQPILVSELPISALQAISSCIESASPKMMKPLGQLMNKFQIQQARVLSFSAHLKSTKVATPYAVDTQLFDLFEVQCFMAKFYEFARGETDELSSNPVLPTPLTKAIIEGFEGRLGLRELIESHSQNR